MYANTAMQEISAPTGIISIQPDASISQILEEIRTQGIHIDRAIIQLFQNQTVAINNQQNRQSLWKIEWVKIEKETPVKETIHQYGCTGEKIDDFFLHLLILIYARDHLPQNPARERILLLFFDSKQELIAINVNKRTVTPFHGNLINPTAQIARITKQ
jgi:hypothetical protein